MKLFAPKYYRHFVCIADKCRHSCCVGWEIDIDEDTADLYASLSNGYGAVIRDSVDPQNTPHFRLAEHDRCPHLNSRGLCRIILSLGEDYLCEICREHPRFYHDTAHGKEIGVGMACEEACRLILASDDYKEFIEIETLDGDLPVPNDFDATAHRKHIYDMLSDPTVPYPTRLYRIQETYDLLNHFPTDEDCREHLASLEYLNEENRASFACYSSAAETPKEFEKQLERALAYFIFRHASGAEDFPTFRTALGLALLCERLLASLAVHAPCKLPFAEWARTVSEEIEYSEDNTETIKEIFLKG